MARPVRIASRNARRVFERRLASSSSWLVLVALAGCETATTASLDAAIASSRDASSLAMDAPLRDGAMRDGAIRDALSATDALGDDASWGSCSVDGVPGTCLDVAACTGDFQSVAGHCPGPSNIRCCVPTTDGGPASDAGVCDPDAHPMPNAGLVEAPGVDGCPSGMIPVGDTLCVDQYEASLVEVQADGSTTEWSPYFHPAGHRVRALSRAGAVPQAYIDGASAGDACDEAGKRLCTDTEWLRACQGPSGTTYPYGDVREIGICNDHRDVHPAVEYFGTSADWIWSRLGEPCIDQLPSSLARTGDFDGCVTSEGAFDMMGNLHEWTADPAGTFRGGYYVDTVLNGPGCLYRTTAHDVSHWDYSTGFRCCADR